MNDAMLISNSSILFNKLLCEALVLKMFINLLNKCEDSFQRSLLREVTLVLLISVQTIGIHSR